MLSGITDHINLSRCNLNTCQFINLRTTTLTKIFGSVNAPSFIHFLFLDTEGSELEILKGIDFNQYKFGYISIEHNYIANSRMII